MSLRRSDAHAQVDPSAGTHRSSRSSWQGRLETSLGQALTAALLLLAGCSTVVFKSSFSANALGAPPSHDQAVGTIDVSGAPGSIVIVGP
ncbi:MAG TPA: hypothetical protein VMK12_00105, partial [Anaeromyxobacteraceae bacterium]|nr:hypothetical protein [Anaeromyxobacteraceae bacterium]